MRIRAIAVALMLGVSACGARSEPGPYTPGDPDAGIDARGVDVPRSRDASVDRSLFRPDVVLRSCDGGPLPRTGTPSRTRIPGRLYATAVLDPDAQRILVLGGLASGGIYAREVYSMDLASGAVRNHPIEGDRVDLPTNAVAVWDARNRRAVVMGGYVESLHGGATAQTFSAQISGAAMRMTRLPDYPVGRSIGAAGAYDPIAGRMLTTGGAGDTLGAPYGATWALDLTPGNERWREMLPAGQSPPASSNGSLVLQPHTGSFVFAGGFASAGTNRTVWVLETTGEPRWRQVEGAADAVQSSRDIVWDPASCGFLMVSGRCSNELWLMRVANGVDMVLLGSPMFDSPAPTDGRVFLDSARDRLVLLGGTNCGVSGALLDGIDVIPILR